MSVNLVVVQYSIMSMKYQDENLQNLQKYCNTLIDILSIELAGYILLNKSTGINLPIKQASCNCVLREGLQTNNLIYGF